MTDLCRKHNVNPSAFSKWKSRFIEGGKRPIESKGASDLIQYGREVDKLKQIIAEQTIVIEEFKKVWRAGQDDAAQPGREDVVKKGVVVRRRVQEHAVL
ncbi:MAG: transposase [Nitrosopumilaceae archaeon]|nr:transposase [Nitrosopumilaceae archaeon]